MAVRRLSVKRTHLHTVLLRVLLARHSSGAAAGTLRASKIFQLVRLVHLRVVAILKALLRPSRDIVLRAADTLQSCVVAEVGVAFVDAEFAARVRILHSKRHGSPFFAQQRPSHNCHRIDYNFQPPLSIC